MSDDHGANLLDQHFVDHFRRPDLALRHRLGRQLDRHGCSIDAGNAVVVATFVEAIELVVTIRAARRHGTRVPLGRSYRAARVSTLSSVLAPEEAVLDDEARLGERRSGIRSET